MTLNQWAIKWGIPFNAVNDLRQEFGLINTDSNSQSDTDIKSEAGIQALVRLEASKKGARLWRNNVGAMMTDTGSFIRYGLVNDSKAMNKNIKSSDLIGIKPILIEQHHVGNIIGQFIAREVKKSTWSYSGKPKEIAQLKFLELVVSLGGNACFVNSGGTI